jgi:predicted O-methyltransferase YrrM
VHPRPLRGFPSGISKAVNEWRRASKRSRKWRQALSLFPLAPDLNREISTILNDIPFYWTPADKQTFLANLITTHGLQRAVEIGVYTGGSFMPQVAAMKRTSGFVIGVDPYSSVEAHQWDNLDRLVTVTEQKLSPDREAMYKDVLELIDKYRLGDYCSIVRAASAEAAPHLKGSIDILHIDGNHDRVRVVEDLRNYLPKVRVGGFVIMDDVDWETISPLYQAIKAQMQPVYETTTWGCCQKTCGAIRI